MSQGAWVEILDVETFRRYKARAEGVIVIRGSTGTTIHHPACPHVREDSLVEKLSHNHFGYFWTDAPENAERRWVSARRCRHPSDPLAGGVGGPEATRSYEPTTSPRRTPDWDIEGPSREFRGVRVNTDRPLPYEPREASQRELRAELRKRLAALVTRADEVLSATYFGPKPANSDLENILLYNIDDSGRCFVGGEAGIRFDYSPCAFPGSSHAATYLYRPIRRRAGSGRWQSTATLARWSGVQLSDHPAARLATWLTLRTAPVELGEWSPVDGVFAVHFVVRPPRAVAAHATWLVKPLIDATVAALQAQHDRSTVSAVADRIAAACGRSSAEIAELLLDPSRAVLGSVPRLAHLRGDGVQLAPSDDRCVAGDVRLGDAPAPGHWVLDATVSAVEPRAAG